MDVSPVAKVSLARESISRFDRLDSRSIESAGEDLVSRVSLAVARDGNVYSGRRRRRQRTLQALAALMFSGFLFSLSLETDPPVLNVLSHETAFAVRRARHSA